MHLQTLVILLKEAAVLPGVLHKSPTPPLCQREAGSAQTRALPCCNAMLSQRLGTSHLLVECQCCTEHCKAPSLEQAVAMNTSGFKMTLK